MLAERYGSCSGDLEQVREKKNYQRTFAMFSMFSVKTVLYEVEMYTCD